MVILSGNVYDKAKAQQGVWLEYGGSRFLVAREGNPEHIAKLTKLIREARESGEYVDETDKLAFETIEIRAMIGTVLRDWEVKSGGKDLAFTIEVAEESLLDTRNHLVLEAVRRASRAETRYLEADQVQKGKK